MRPVRPCASCTVDTPRRSSVAIAPASARWMLRITIPLMSSRSGDSARLEEFCQRLAAEVGHHFGIRNALGARELLQAEEARAVVLHPLPVEAAHELLLLLGQGLHRLFRLLFELFPEGGIRQRMQKPVQSQPSCTSLQVEKVFHSNKATAMAVVIGR